MAGTGLSRWYGVGSSNRSDPGEAGREAAAAASVGADPALVMVFASTSYELEPLTEAIAGIAPDVPMIGCTTAGEISTGQARERSVVVAMLGGGFHAVTGCARAASSNLSAAGTAVARIAGQLPDAEHQILLLLTDGLAGNQAEVVRGAYEELGASVPLVGGCAGDDAAMVKTFQIHDGTVVEDAVVGAAIASDHPMGIGVRHGWRPVGEPMLVSRAEDTTVFELDGAPALDRYVERLDANPAIAADPDLFTTYAMTHPLGLRRRSGEEVRFINGADFETRALVSIAEIPQGSLVWVMEGDRESVLAGTAASCEQALSALNGEPPIGLLLFDCIARRGVLGGDGVWSEMAAVSRSIPSVPTAGFYTYGEIARTHGVRGFHNQTLVTLALS